MIQNVSFFKVVILFITIGKRIDSLNKPNTDYAKKMAKAHLKSNGLGVYAPPEKKGVKSIS